MDRARTLSLTGVALALASTTACEPRFDVGPRERTSPALIAATSCEELEATLKERLRHELDGYVLIGARQQSYGAPGTGADLYGAFWVSPDVDILGNPISMVVSGDGRSDRVIARDDGRLLVLAGGRLHLLSFDDDGVPDVVAASSIEGSALSFLVEGDEILVLSQIDPFGAVPGTPLAEFLRNTPKIIDDPSVAVSIEAPVSWSKLTRFTLAGDALDEGEALYVEGVPQALVRSGDGALLVSRYDVLSSSFRLWPQTDDTSIIGLFTTGRAVTDSQAHNASILEQMTLDDITPRVVAVDGTATQLTTPCTSTLGAEDSPARAQTTFTRVGFASLTAPAVEALLSGPGAIVVDDERIVVIEEAAPLWWYFDVDDVPFETNVHQLTVDATGFATHGSLRVSGVLPTARAVTPDASGAVLFSTTTLIWDVTRDGTPGVSALWRVDPALDLTSRTAGLAPNVRPGGLTAVFDDVYVETLPAFDDALRLRAATLDGDAAVALPGRLDRALVDDDLAFLVEVTTDGFGFRTGGLRITEVTPTTTGAPVVRMTLAGPISPTRGEVVRDEEPVAIGDGTVAVEVTAGDVDPASYAIFDEVMFVPLPLTTGGTELAVIARRRDGGLSLVGRVRDGATASDFPPTIERVFVVGGRFVTTSHKGIVVRDLATLDEVARVTIDTAG